MLDLLQLILQETTATRATAAPASAQDPHPDAAPHREQSRAARGATSPTITISTGGSTPSSSTATGNIPAPISTIRMPASRRLSWPRSGTSRPSCWSSRDSGSSTSAPAGAGSASISVRSRVRLCAWHHLVGASSWRSRASGPRRPACRTGSEFDLEDYRDTDGQLRPDRLGRHVRACGPALLRHLFLRRAASC